MAKSVATLIPAMTAGLLAAAGCMSSAKVIDRGVVQNTDTYRFSEEELLLNVVRSRYGDALLEPIIAGPTGAGRDPTGCIRLADYYTPISAGALVELTASGWPVSDVLRIWVDGLNGVPNRGIPSSLACKRSPDHERFRRAADLLQTTLDRRLIALAGENRITTVSGELPAGAVTTADVQVAARAGLAFRTCDGGRAYELTRSVPQAIMLVSPEGRSSPEWAEFAALTNLNSATDRFDLAVANGVPDPATIPTEPVTAIQITPRCVAQVLSFLANGVDVPPEHVARGLVLLPSDGQTTAATRDLFRVRSTPASDAPPEASCAVRYRDRWFYIDGGDEQSKETLRRLLQYCNSQRMHHEPDINDRLSNIGDAALGRLHQFVICEQPGTAGISKTGNHPEVR